MFVLRQRPGGNVSSAEESEEDVSETEIIQVKTIPIIRKQINNNGILSIHKYFIKV